MRTRQSRCTARKQGMYDHIGAGGRCRAWCMMKRRQARGKDEETTMATDVSRKVDRRAALLQAAREVLAEKGYEATKVSDIVARAGAAQGTFYLYFPSKLSLVL